ncbi:HDOD domain-containing protein [Propionivibrio sp.]|uniref:HDOD domain-containing protein n=2 Tax=Propionivibrio sp. TaxID=2212460 RepID=UPI0025CFEAF6|nr:HDOD domain-containing protein [Propionivibrio sp.]
MNTHSETTPREPSPAPTMALELPQVVGQIGTLPSLPAVIMELIQSLGDENIDTHQLAKKIGSDQALVAKMLRVANSSFYGLQGKVTSIQDVVVVLGLRSVRTLAMAAAVTGSFSSRNAVPGFDFSSFWRHSMGTALCARALARRLKLSEENAFTAGLLHDIGRLVLVACFPAHLTAVMAYRNTHDCLWLDAERAVIGIDHAGIGEALTAHWKFPSSIRESVACHHALDACEHSPLTGVVHVADVIAHALELSRGAPSLVPLLCGGVWDSLTLVEKDFQAIFGEVETQFEGACQMLST